MSFLGRIKALFLKKEKKTEAVEHAESEPQEQHTGHPSTNERLEVKPEDAHKEKKCPYCTAPNDYFVSVCWMYKKKI